MAIRRLRWYVWLLIGLVLVPPLLWVAVVMVAPTGWARSKLVAILESRSGRKVGLDGLSVRLLGGVRLTNLEIGAREASATPGQRPARSASISARSRSFRGDSSRRGSRLMGPSRVLRRADGKVELADLIRPVPPPAVSLSGRWKRPEHIAVQVRNAHVTVVDMPTQTQLQLLDVEGEGHSEGPRAVVNHLRGTLNGGRFRFAAQLDRTAQALGLKTQFRAEDVQLDDGMKILRYVVPVLAGAPRPSRGGSMPTSMPRWGATWRELCSSLAGRGVIALNPIELNGAPLVAELSRSRRSDRPPARATIRTDFLVNDRRSAPTSSRSISAVAHHPLRLDRS